MALALLIGCVPEAIPEPVDLSCDEATCTPEVVATYPHEAAQLNLALSGPHIYACAVGLPWPLARFPRGGGQPEEVRPLPRGCGLLLIDEPDGQVYWTDASPRRLLRAPLEGGAEPSLLWVAPAITGLAVSDGYLYATGQEQPPPPSDPLHDPPPRRGLYAAPKNASRLAFVDSTRGDTTPAGLTVGPDGRVILSFPEVWDVLSVIGGSGEGLLVLHDGRLPPGSAPGPASVAVDERHAYFALGSALWRAPVDGKSPAQIAADGMLTPGEVVADGAGVWWLDDEAGLLYRLDPSTLRRSVVARGLRLPRSLRHDATHLYWAESSRVVRLRKQQP